MYYHKVKGQLNNVPEKEIDDYAEVTVDSGWYADDGNAEVHYPSASSGHEAAEEYVSDGDWNEDRTKTIWVDVRTWRRAVVEDTEGDEVELEIYSSWHSIELDPEDPSPDCNHDWCSPYSVLGGCKENPGVWGKGGGVIVKEVCGHCGIYRITDTWAQNSSTGEQGLHSVQYEDADDDSAEWVEQQQANE